MTTETFAHFPEAIPEIKELIAELNWPGLNLLLGGFHPTVVAEEWDQFTLPEKLAILRHFEVQKAVDIFEELEIDRQKRLIQELTESRATALLEEMAPDERADLFAEFPPALSERLLRGMEAEEAQDVLDLLTHEADTAGGEMTSDYAWALVDETVGQAIRRFRENFHEAEVVYYVYVLDPKDHLEGVVTLRQLMLTNDERPIRDIMFTQLVTVPPEMDREDMALEMQQYNLLAVPVVDDTGKMLGIVTHDDVLDVLSMEATEDFEQFAAVIPSDEESTYLTMPVTQHFKLRIPWLVLLLFLSSISGFLIMHFSGLIETRYEAMWFTLLMTLAPMLMATAGNAGTQSATMVIRDMATGDLNLDAIKRVFLKELSIGLLIGAALALCAFLRALIPSAPHGEEEVAASLPQLMMLGGIAGLAVFVSMAFATTAGAILPMLVKRLKLDPAVMSSPLLATIIDNVAVFLYFAIAMVALSFYLGVN